MPTRNGAHLPILDPMRTCRKYILRTSLASLNCMHLQDAIKGECMGVHGQLEDKYRQALPAELTWWMDLSPGDRGMK
jgi:hypothetical protein